MDLPASFPTAIAAILLGAGLLGLLLISLRLFAARWVRARVTSPVALPVDTEGIEAGVLLAQGGRVLFANERAREFFGLNGQTPNLERLAQKAQPAETFRELFLVEGRADLSIGDRRVEATSLKMQSQTGALPQFVVVL
ncbi:MAG: hypothetical protein ACRDH2_14390, partial [Anaerolineales bacterium]